MGEVAGGEEGNEEGGRMSLFRALIITRQIAEGVCVPAGERGSVCVLVSVCVSESEKARCQDM